MDGRDRLDGNDGPDRPAREEGEPSEGHGAGESPLDHRLREALGSGYPSPHFPGEEIEAEIRASVAERGPGGASGRGAGAAWWRGPTARSALAAAAALVVFIGGAEYGRRTGASGVPGAAVESPVPVPATYEQTASVPLDIQSAGSRYVATLARFSGEAARLSVEERRMAREVALAALYGAAVELLREAGDDETLEAVAEMVARRRGDSGQLNDGARSF